MNTVKLICHNCKLFFESPAKEYKRQTKKGRKEFFCTLSCSMAWKNKYDLRMIENRGKFSFANISAEKRKEIQILSGKYPKYPKPHFAYYLRKARSRKWDNNLDYDYLINLWDIQEGKCAISKVSIFHGHTKREEKAKPDTASLDRIDSSQGYIKGNVQFVAHSINLAKNSFTNEEFLAFYNSLP